MQIDVVYVGWITGPAALPCSRPPPSRASVAARSAGHHASPPQQLRDAQVLHGALSVQCDQVLVAFCPVVFCLVFLFAFNSWRPGEFVDMLSILDCFCLGLEIGQVA